MATDVEKAICSKDLSKIKDILQQKEAKHEAFMCLLSAVSAEDQERAMLLLNVGVPVVSSDSDVMVADSPLHLACKNGLVEVVKAIPNLEGCINCLAICPEWAGEKVTPFQCVLVKYVKLISKVHCLQWVIENHLKTVPKPDQSLTLLMSYLLEKGADPNSPFQPSQNRNRVLTALHIACSTPCNTELAKNLLIHGAKVKVEDDIGLRPLTTALKAQYPCGEFQEYYDLIEDLLKAGSVPNNVVNEEGNLHHQTPLTYAMAKDARLVQLLLKYGANVNEFDQEKHLYIIKRFSDCYQYLPVTKKIASLNVLLDPSTKINIHRIGENGQNFFHFLCSGFHDQPEIVPAILHKQPGLSEYLNLPDDNGTLPLFFAFYNFNIQTALALIQQGAVVNVVRGETPETIFMTAVYTYLEEGIRSEEDYESDESDVDFIPPKPVTPEELRIFVEEIVNKGWLSKVYFKIAWRDEKVEWCNTLSGLQAEEIFNLVQELSEKMKLPESECVKYKVATEPLLSFLVESDIVLSIGRTMIWNKVNALNKNHDIELLKQLCNSMQEAMEEVVELKRLCRAVIRVHISTVHAQGKRVLDLRDLFRMLPLPLHMKEYIMIKSNH